MAIIQADLAIYVGWQPGSRGLLKQSITAILRGALNLYCPYGRGVKAVEYGFVGESLLWL